jgi:hypothetical protein
LAVTDEHPFPQQLAADRASAIASKLTWKMLDSQAKITETRIESGQNGAANLCPVREEKTAKNIRLSGDSFRAIQESTDVG